MPKESSSTVRVFYPKFDTRWVVETIKANLAELQRQLLVKLVVLFGSYARGNYTVASDVDLMVVYQGERREDAYSVVVRTMAVPRLEAHVYSEAEYAQLKGTLDRMMAGGIAILGEV